MEVIPSYIVAGERFNRLLGRVTIRRGSLDEFKGSALWGVRTSYSDHVVETAPWQESR